MTNMNPIAPIYADFASSAGPLPEVVDAMLEWLGPKHANPHASHLPGQMAARAVNEARENIAKLIDADPEGVIFTSGATESNNLALKGLSGLEASTLYYSPLDHSSIVESAIAAKHAYRCKLAEMRHDGDGLIVISELAELLVESANEGSLVAVAHGNNEIGAIQDVKAIGRIAEESGHLLHVDASQTAAHVVLSQREFCATSISLSSHKMYGPGGIGALWVDPLLHKKLRVQQHGGGQQRGIRSGTIPVYLAVGMGVAATAALLELESHAAHLHRLVDEMLAALSARGCQPDVVGPVGNRLPGHLSIRFSGVNAADLLSRLLPLISISMGSACSAGEMKASRVLRVLGLDEEMAGEVLRISFGRTSTSRDVVLAAEYLSSAVFDLSGAPTQ